MFKNQKACLQIFYCIVFNLKSADYRQIAHIWWIQISHFLLIS